MEFAGVHRVLLAHSTPNCSAPRKSAVSISTMPLPPKVSDVRFHLANGSLIVGVGQVYTWLCGLFAALGSVTFGYDLGIIASVLVSFWPKYEAQCPLLNA